MPWQVRLITTLDWIDHRILRHRVGPLCPRIASSPWWDLASDDDLEAHVRRLGIPRTTLEIAARTVDVLAPERTP